MTATRPDPLLAAGHVRCGQCGRAAWPVTATWISDRMLIAAYPAPCGHTTAKTWTVTPAELDPGTDWCPATAATTGDPCRHRPRPGSPWCAAHDPERQRPASEGRRAP